MSGERGVLAPGDKEYLRGERTYDEEQSERQRRYRLRRKIRQAIIDFSLVRPQLDREDLALLFEDIGPTVSESPEATNPGLTIPGTEGEMYHGIVETLAFLYEGTKTQSDLDFEYLLETAIHQVGPTRDSPAGQSLAGVDVIIERQYRHDLDPDTLLEKFETAPYHLTIEEIGKLVVEGELSPEDIEQLEPRLATRSADQAIITREQDDMFKTTGRDEE